MSFQKAHNVSNELGEVVVTSADIDLDSTGPTPLAVQAPYKNYRILELGFVVTANVVQSTLLTVEFGDQTDSDGFVDTTATLTLPANSLGTTFSTSTGAFDFEVPTTVADPTLVDADGVPTLSAGQRIVFTVAAAAGTATRAVVFARLAPLPEYKD